MTDEDIRRLQDILAITSSILGIAIALRLLLGPDATTTLRMRMLRGSSRAAKKVARVAETFASDCDTAYMRLTNVTA